jgi:MoaA/NifB/PqqE/SkfB family radical SAM enzyme
LGICKERSLNRLVALGVRLVRWATGLSARQLALPHAWIPYHLYDDGSAWRPLSVTLELTYLCNLRCQMCSLVEGNVVTRPGQRQNPELREPDGSLRREVSTAEYARLIRQIGQAGVQAVTLTGGEPTLRRDLPTLVRAIKAFPIHLSMITNGSAPPDVYKELIRLGLDSLTVSIDGTRDVHDRVRGVKGSFDRAMAAIQAVLDTRRAGGLRRPWLAVACAISALNQDDIENVVQWFQGTGVDALNFGYLHFSTPERQQATEEQVGGRILHLKRHELAARVVGVDTAALAARVARIKAGRDGHATAVTFTPDLTAEETHRQYTDATFTFANKCFQPWLATRIDPWGQMYPCWIDIRLGDVREHGFLPLWNSPRYKQFRRAVREHKLVAKCATCPALTDRLWSRVPTLNRGLLNRSACGAKARC